MEDKDNNQMTVLAELMLRKRKLIELREEIKLKSSGRNETNEKGECSPGALFSNEQPSISPPPFSPLTPLSFKTKQRKLQCEYISDPLCTISTPLASSSAVKIDTNNIFDPPSSPIPTMSPETQQLFNVLTEAELESENSLDVIENSDISENERHFCYEAASDDSLKDPPFRVYYNASQRLVDDSETDCDSTYNIGEAFENNKSKQLCTTIPTKNTGISEKQPVTLSISNEKEIRNTAPTGNVIQTENLEDLHINLQNTSLTPSLVDMSALTDNTHAAVQTINLNKEIIDNNLKKNKGRSRKERKECKILRNSGKSYVTEKGKVVLARQTKDLRLCRLKCAERITVTEREQSFENYWKLGQRDRRAAFVSKSITILPKKSQTTGCIEKNRDCYCVYKLLISNEERSICKECFCRILGETKGFVNVVIEKKKQSPTGIVDSDQRGLKPPKNKKTDEEIKFVRNHISSFPAYESHYCRKSTGKKYLASDLSIAKMYREYKTSTSNPVSLKLYAKCFHDLNLSFKQPSKDTCNTCDVFSAKIKVAVEDRKINLLAELAEHQSLAEKAYSEKRIDKDIIKNDRSIRAFAFDLQQCLPTPYLKTSVSFYKRQLWSFNLTIHDLGSNEATCYMWDETIGSRGANQIASCLWHFCQRLPSDVKEIIFYSDTCGGQNKNNIVAMMFMHLLNEHPTLKTINHKFLLSGHTHMECDSDHAIIEKAKKRTQMKINHLYDWVQLVRTCKVRNHFKAVVMTLNDFFDFSELKSKKGPFSLKKNDVSGQRFLWQPIKWLQYNKSNFGTINFKDNLDRESDFNSVNFRKRGRSHNYEVFRLKEISKEPLPISDEKKKDLMDLLELVDPAFRDFYVNLKTTACIPTDPDINEDDPDLEQQNNS